MNLLAKRIQARLDELGMTARRASLEAGLSPGAVGKMLSGESESPRAKNLQSLATVLQCNPAYLTGGMEEPGDLVGPVDGDPTIRIAGEARLGSWSVSHEPMAGAGVLFMPPLPDAPAMRQQAIILVDRHMDDLFPPKTILHLETGKSIALDDGDVVVISRLRFNGEMAEITARQVRIRGFQTGGSPIELTTRYRDPILNDVIEYTPSGSNQYEGDEPGGDKVLIIGRAVRAYIGLAKPDLYELDDERRRIELITGYKKFLTRD
ncbi:helix-turn-helix domain-containing protein [Brevundimonas sp. CEF1]|uniref:helix-turn-helix domain-containing protein n=1 Tax=Brevundimonas sp. CEF1 TaxID=3442642 RepID=UPI003F511784